LWIPNIFRSGLAVGAATAQAIRALGREVLAERVDVADRGQMAAFAAAVHGRLFRPSRPREGLETLRALSNGPMQVRSRLRRTREEER